VTARQVAHPQDTAESIRFADVLSAERMKITTLPATWIALVIAFAANTLLGVIAGTDAIRVAGRDGAVPIAQLGTLMLAPVYVFIAVAVFAAGSEYREGQLRVGLTAVPDRGRLFTAKLAASTTISLLASIPVILPGYVLQHAPAWGGGDATAGDVAAGLAALPVVYLLLSVIGYGFAVVSKSVVTPIAVLFVTPVLISPALQDALPAVVRFLPHEAALSFLGLPPDPSTAIGRVAGLSVLTAWATVFAAAARRFFVRGDS
jgi:ABC-2 type transport system permease protein